MPSCCMKNCKNRTYKSSKREHVTFYTFPKEAELREQWLHACERNETNLKIDSARICSDHFDTSCFIMEFTKSKDRPVRELRRLKKGSVPCKIRNEKRQVSENESIKNKKIKITNLLPRTISICTQLAQYAKEKQCIKEEAVEEIVLNTKESNVQDQYYKNAKKNDTIKLDMNKEISVNNISMETLLTQFRNSEKRNQQLHVEKENLKHENKQLNMQITWLRAKVTKIKQDSEIATKALRKCHLSETPQTPSTDQPGPPLQKKKKISPNDSIEELVDLATAYFKKPESEWELVVKGWAVKLGRLDPDQRRFAEKIINDTLFEAELGTLTRHGVGFLTSSQSMLPPSSSMSPA